MMPRDDPGGAIYCILFGSGCFVPLEKGRSPGLNKCLRTNWSSCEKAHSVSDIRSLAGELVANEAGRGGGGVCDDRAVSCGVGVAGFL